MFLVERIHHSVSSDQFQFDISCYGHANPFFHSGQDEESMSDFYMNYEDDDSFVLPIGLFANVDTLGETNDNEIFSLP